MSYSQEAHLGLYFELILKTLENYDKLCDIFIMFRQSLLGVRGWGQPLADHRGLEESRERRQEVVGWRN